MWTYKKVKEHQLTAILHNGNNCKNDYPKSFIGKTNNGFKVTGYHRDKTQYILEIECIECGTKRQIPISHFNSYICNHSACCKFLPVDDTKSSLMRRWDNINQRCHNPKSNNYKSYGQRGIRNDFKDFIEFYNFFYPELSKHPEYTIDRIDVNGNYSKDNCRLITDKDQHSNMQATLYFIGTDGQKTVYSNNAMEFARKYNLNGNAISNCCRGSSKSSGGWTFKKISKEQFFNDLKGVTTNVTIVQEVDSENLSSVVPSI